MSAEWPHRPRPPVGARLAVVALATATLTWIVPGGAQPSEAVAKQVHLVVNGNRLIASNVRFSRFDELKLQAQEQLEEQIEGEAVIVVVTNQRLLAYGAFSGWKSMRRKAGEEIQSVRAEDYAALVETSDRFLNFNGRTGVWGERDRRVSN